MHDANFSGNSHKTLHCCELKKRVNVVTFRIECVYWRLYVHKTDALNYVDIFDG